MSLQPPPDAASFGEPGGGDPDGADAARARAGAFERAQNADIDAVADELAHDARRWAGQLQRCAALAARAQRSGRDADRRFLVLELAGSWRIAQVTATRWIDDAERFADALPLTLGLLEQGRLFRHQAKALLHGTRHCTAEIARAVEAELLPDSVELCPSDLRRRIDRAVLRHESAATDAQAAEQRHASAAASRRVWTRGQADGLALVGAVLTAEQAVAFDTALGVLERRERCADRHAGVDRTVEQRRADLLAALPAMVLAGTAQHARDAAAGRPGRPWTLGPEQLAAQVVLNIHVPIATVLDLRREPGHLQGYGPISAEHVRLVRPHAVRRIMVDSTSGRPVAVDDRTTPLHPTSRTRPTRRTRPTSRTRPTRRTRPTSRTRPTRRTRPTATDPTATGAATAIGAAAAVTPGPVTDGPTDAHDSAADTRARLDRLARAMLRPDVIVDRDEARHDPSAHLARLVDVRDVHCCGPGCSSTHTDRDHGDPWPTGPTNADNLHRLSPRCHAAKHHDWHPEHHPDGSTTWTSPLRRTYHRPSPHTPPPRVDLYQRPRRPTAPPQPTTPPTHRDDRERPPDSRDTSTPAPAPPSRPQPDRTDDDDPPPF